MFELPLLPHMIAYGRIQWTANREIWRVADSERFFVDVIGGANATLDGLHLSNAGALSMAALVAKVLSPVLRSPATARPDKLDS
jgi:lysophospholipase L1-like esterase